MIITFNLFLVYFFVFFLSACFGSFFKLVVDRYETGESVIFSSSKCDFSHKKLSWWHNIPIISYLILRGKSFFTKEKISFNYFLSELIPGVLVTILFFAFYNSGKNLYEIITVTIFMLLLILLSMFDLKHRVIPHQITYTAILIVLTLKYFFSWDFLFSLASMGAVFIFMDILHTLAGALKKYDFEENIIVFPLIAWTLICFFKINFLFLLISLLIYFLLVFLKIKFLKHVYYWVILFFLIPLFIYKNLLISGNIFHIKSFFVGVGIIYLICEIIFYYFILFVPAFQEEEEAGEPKYALGGGDITVLALISAYLGFNIGFLTLLIASLLAIFSQVIRWVVSKVTSKKDLQASQYVPFVPFLSAACFIIIILTNAY